MKISVIIPIYKVEDYLIRCVNSVLNQDYRDLEVILVDDGSPDGCPQMCDDFQKQDSRVKVIHKSNGGLSSARNAGVNIATGEYVTFLDSDDQWGEHKLKSILSQIKDEEVDIIFFKNIDIFPDGVLRERIANKFYLNTGRKYSRVELYPFFISEGNLREQAGTHFVKRSFLINNNLYFKEGILGEDTEWMFRALRIVGDMIVINDYLQIYTSGRAGSITDSIKSKSLNELLRVIRSSVEFYRQNNDVNVKHWELAHCAYLWSIALGFYSVLDSTTRAQFKDELKKLFKYLPMKQHPKARKVYICYEFLGFTITSYLLKTFMQLRKKIIFIKQKKYNG